MFMYAQLGGDDFAGQTVGAAQNDPQRARCAMTSNLPFQERPLIAGKNNRRHWTSCSACGLRRREQARAEAAAKSYAVQRERYSAAKTGLVELALAEREGQLIPAKETTEAITALFGLMKTRLLAIPSNIAASWPGDPAAGEQAIRAALYAALEAFAQFDAAKIAREAERTKEADKRERHAMEACGSTLFQSHEVAVSGIIIFVPAASLFLQPPHVAKNVLRSGFHKNVKFQTILRP